MKETIELRESIDHAFGSEPPHRDLDGLLAAGHRRIRRRRIARLSAGLAVVAVIGAGYQTVSHPRNPSAPVPVAGSAGLGAHAAERWEKDELLRYGKAGELQVNPKLTIRKRVPNPLGLAAPEYSDGLVLVDDSGRETWVLAQADAGGFGLNNSTPGVRLPSFDYWLADTVALYQETPTLALVKYGRDGELLPRPGVEILQQTATPKLPADWVGDSKNWTVAEVTFEGRRWWVLARFSPQLRPGFRYDYTPYAASVVGDTLEEFLDHLRGEADADE
ncbi:MAG: hypothetical protein ACRCYQ_03885 [Nocardioides sp.]